MSDTDPGVKLFLRKVEGRHPLSDEARQAFLSLPYKRHSVALYRDVVREGKRSFTCCLMSEGVVSRYKTLPNGGRQINSFHIPGDMIDLQSALMLVADHGIRTHTPTVVLDFDCFDILQLSSDYAEWGRALWFDTMVDSSIFREWMLNVGRRPAVSRVAHLLLEFAHRLHSIGESDGFKFTLPVTQIDLADAAGLSSVHTNRSLQRLREDGLIRTYGKTVVIEKRQELARLATFESTYLEPEGPRMPLLA